MPREDVTDNVPASGATDTQYAPQTPGDWATAPRSAQEALDSLAAAPPGGASDLDGLTDVTITGPVADNEVLAYDSGSSEWINQTPTEAGIGGITGPGASTDNAIVRWDGVAGTTIQNSSVTVSDALAAPNRIEISAAAGYSLYWITNTDHIFRAANYSFYDSTGVSLALQLGSGFFGNNYLFIGGYASPTPARLAPAGTGDGHGEKDLLIEIPQGIAASGRLCLKMGNEITPLLTDHAAWRRRFAVLARGGTHGLVTAAGQMLVSDEVGGASPALSAFAAPGSDGLVLTSNTALDQKMEWAPPVVRELHCDLVLSAEGVGIG